MVGDGTVTRLLALARDAGLTVKVVSGISVVEPALRLLGVNALNGLQVLDSASLAAMHHPPINPDTAALLAACARGEPPSAQARAAEPVSRHV
ncbi:MAG: hypothetical protein U0694_02205 [Anaerolineae bacterium]